MPEISVLNHLRLEFPIWISKPLSKIFQTTLVNLLQLDMLNWWNTWVEVLRVHNFLYRVWICYVKWRTIVWRIFETKPKWILRKKYYDQLGHEQGRIWIIFIEEIYWRPWIWDIILWKKKQKSLIKKTSNFYEKS